MEKPSNFDAINSYITGMLMQSLGKLLIQKGLITEDEWKQAMQDAHTKMIEGLNHAKTLHINSRGA